MAQSTTMDRDSWVTLVAWGKPSMTTGFADERPRPVDPSAAWSFVEKLNERSEK